MIQWCREYFKEKDLKRKEAWEKEISDHQQTLRRWLDESYYLQGSKVVAEDAQERKAIKMASNVIRLF